MLCRTCGRELQKEQAFCPNCGTINDQAGGKSEPSWQNKVNTEEQEQNVIYQAQKNASKDSEPEEQQIQEEQRMKEEQQIQEEQAQIQQTQWNQNQTQQTQTKQTQWNQNQTQQTQWNQTQIHQTQPARQIYSNPNYRQVTPGQPYPYPPYQSGQGTLPPPLPPSAYIRSSKGPLYIFLVIYVIFLLIFGAFMIAVIVEAAKQTESSIAEINYSWNEDTVDPAENEENIIPYEEEAVPFEEDQGPEKSYNNYNYFITGREQAVFDLSQEIMMENNISFLLEEVNITELGDGTSVFVAKIRLKSEAEGNHFCLDDFLILPRDADNTMLADAMAAEYIKDSEGNELMTPLELPTDGYEVYTVSYILPMNTKYFTVYGTNYYNEGFAGPVYVCDMEVNN